MAKKSHEEEQGVVEARQRALKAREGALSSREQAGSQREHTVGIREESVLSREQAIELREELVRAREEMERAVAARQAALEQIREVNEKLVLASLRAHEASDEAEEARAKAEETARALAVSENALRAEAAYRERLIGIVGHDLRNPVTAIGMAAEMLAREHGLTPRSRQMAASIQASTRRVRRIIDELLDFTRAHLGGGIWLNLKPSNLQTISRRVVEELEVGLAGSARIACSFEGNLDGVWDSDRLEQVISNLAGNALQHGTPGEQILLEVVGEEEQVTLKLTNRGQAIPRELLPVLFLPFSRGKPGERPRGGSLGLGLYISHEIVQQHGGTISVRSGDGGTTFTIQLPRKPPSHLNLVPIATRDELGLAPL